MPQPRVPPEGELPHRAAVPSRHLQRLAVVRNRHLHPAELSQHLAVELNRLRPVRLQERVPLHDLRPVAQPHSLHRARQF